MGKENVTHFDVNMQMILELAAHIQVHAKISSVSVEIGTERISKDVVPFVTIRGTCCGEIFSNSLHVCAYNSLPVFIEQTIEEFKRLKAASEEIEEEIAKRKQVEDTYTKGKYRTAVPF